MAEGIVVSIHLASGATDRCAGSPRPARCPGVAWRATVTSRGGGRSPAAPTPPRPRRSVVTRGVDLNGLVGEEFRVGEVLLRGARPAEPCAHLARLAGEEVLPGLVHRGGLRAEIVAGGTLRVGDAVEGPRG